MLLDFLIHKVSNVLVFLVFFDSNLIGCSRTRFDTDSVYLYGLRGSSVTGILMDYYKNIFTADTMECHNIGENPFEYANKYTPHRFVANLNTTNFEFPGCNPVKLWLLVRHGVRTMDASTRNLASKRLSIIGHHILHGHMAGKGDLNENTLSAFKNWEEKLLIDENLDVGENEMFSLAERTRKRYQDFFKSNYSSHQHKFRSSSVPRAKQSAYSFAKGLFPDELDKIRAIKLVNDDFVLRFHTRCKLWEKSNHRNPQIFSELKQFLTGPVMAETLIRISHRLGLNYTLSYGDVKLMLKYCTARSVSEQEYSPWCLIFSKEELKVMDFSEDLREYYRHSYPSEINYKQACPMVRDLMEFLSDDSQGPPQAQFLFSHSGSILKFITAMGLFRDENHLNENDLHKREWRGSSIDAFGSNYASVLYKCDDDVKRVLTLYQERPVMMENCDTILCPLEVLQENFKDYKGCNFDKICENNR